MIILILLLVVTEVPDDFFPVQPMIEEINPLEYSVGAGDILWFSIQGGIPVELSGCESGSIMYITVTPDGYAVIPSAGAWLVAGLKLYEAASMIENGFAARYPGIRGMAGLAAIRTFRIPVTGQVSFQGMYNVNESSRLTDILDMAGGITSVGSWTSIQIASSNGDTAIVDITDFLLNGSMQSNPTLAQGDRVHVPQAEEFVTVEGAVRLAGSMSVGFSGGADQAVWTGSTRGVVQYVPAEPVSRLINRVGGTQSWADRDNCYILRADTDGNEIKLIAPLDDPSIDPELLPGDIVICPGTPPVVAVSGFVSSPGVYPHIAGMGDLYYISQAGGLLREASAGGIRIVLPDGSEIDADDIEVIPPGSAITVPRQTLVGWQDPLRILTGIASVIIAWKSVF